MTNLSIMPTPDIEVAAEDELVLNALVEYYGDFDEIWLGPAIRHISEALPEVRFVKRCIRRLEHIGAIRVIERDGDPHKYSVLEFVESNDIIRRARQGLL